MKILYAIQGTGNGHMARAREVIPELEKFCDFDILIGGSRYELDLGYKVDHRVKSLTLSYDQNGKLSLTKTFRENSFGLFLKEVATLPVKDYDLVISDFEPVSAWACKLRDVPCVALSHQAAFHSEDAPRPSRKSRVGEFILRNFAPTARHYGFHFMSYADGIYSPLVRNAVKMMEPENGDHYTVYLPAFSKEKINEILGEYTETNWQVFTAQVNEEEVCGNVHFFPVCGSRFLESMRTCRGVLCNAGFETPSEALYLRKKLLVIPIKGQYEQQCNAEALSQLGVDVIENFNTTNAKLTISRWLVSSAVAPLSFPEELPRVTHKIFEDYISEDLNRQGSLSWNFNLF
ncbi:glycosyltransferase family protein [Halocola ammonii]